MDVRVARGRRVRRRVFTDSDWAGGLRTREFTSRGVAMLGAHCLKTWCLTQSANALGSAEAGCYSMVEGATRGIGIQTMLQELGVHSSITLLPDTGVARSLGSQRGTDKTRHLETKWLWLQAEVAKGKIRLEKVAGGENPSDVLTKYKGGRDIQRLLAKMNIEIVNEHSG